MTKDDWDLLPYNPTYPKSYQAKIIAHVEHIKKEVLRIPFYDTIRAHSPNLEVYIRSQVQPCNLET